MADNHKGATTSSVSQNEPFLNHAKKIFPDTCHHKVKCLNNKTENSHVPMKQMYRPMRGFMNIDRATIFLESFESLYRYFRKICPHSQQMRNLYKLKLNEFNAMLNLNSAF